MTLAPPSHTIMRALDAPTAELVRLAVVIAAGAEQEVRLALTRAASGVTDPEWVEELILQTYLFAGFPRALNAARMWRRASGRPAPRRDPETSITNAPSWQARGEATCGEVYGDMYERLRANVRELHPALDSWMIVDGYGKVLGRDGLDLRRRELCIVAVCAALEQDRQLHAHLHGALNTGASSDEVEEALRYGSERLDEDARQRFTMLWARVRRRA
ncbi:MAG TPA: carboxymuconolactone decarboxylase family protein [Gemmatimonadaceae bacterium]|nr:carboxymuconolactone decarboxylase family protein [Gemmatimonadaceae bacterium]